MVQPNKKRGLAGLYNSLLEKEDSRSSSGDVLLQNGKSSTANGENIAKEKSGPTSSLEPKDDESSSSRGDAWMKNEKSAIEYGANTSKFKSEHDNGIPLAEQMRPSALDEYIGQESVLSNNSFLSNLINQDNFINMILWGPPGCGKTSLANIINKKCRASSKWRYSSLSCCTSGVQEVRGAIQEAKSSLQLRKKRTVLFMDEVHRFNKAQQDVFLPHVESGLITLVGATTENPSFSLNSALLSRCRVIVLEALSTESICQIIRRALKKLNLKVVNCEESTDNEHDEEVMDEDLNFENTNSQSRLSIQSDAVQWLAEMCGGDARSALNTLQTLVQSHTDSEPITVAHAKEALQRSHVSYDRKGDEHYNFASALQKSIRGGDDNAALYWTMRMVKGGEDPKFIARRLVRTAAEDIGIGDPQALTMAVSTMQAVQMLGMPESDVILAECAVYLARAHHNPEVYQAMNRVKEHMKNHPGLLPSVPLHLRNATTGLMKNMGYGNGYSYDPSKVRGIKYMPEELGGRNFFKN